MKLVNWTKSHTKKINNGTKKKYPTMTKSSKKKYAEIFPHIYEFQCVYTRLMSSVMYIRVYVNIGAFINIRNRPTKWPILFFFLFLLICWCCFFLRFSFSFSCTLAFQFNYTSQCLHTHNRKNMHRDWEKKIVHTKLTRVSRSWLFPFFFSYFPRICVLLFKQNKTKHTIKFLSIVNS